MSLSRARGRAHRSYDGAARQQRSYTIFGTRHGFGAMRPVVLALAKLVALPLASAAPLGLWERGVRMLKDNDEDLPKSPQDPDLYIYLSVAVVLVLLGGAFAGLTIALMGQDETYLQVIATSGEGSEKKHAKKVLNLLNKGKHWVLVTLLLSNVITNETLPIVLDRSLGGGWPAVLSSTVLIVIFGEIAPQSVCVRYGLSIGAFMAPAVLILMWIMSPVAWPTAKLLDWLLGEDHGTTYKKAGLKTLVQLHKTLGTTPGERLMEDEVTIINSVLDLKEKPVGDIMTPMGDVFTMSADTVLDERMMDTILSQGYSRIPVYAPDDSRNFIGMLLVKILITYDPEDCMRVRDFALATLPETSPYTSCLDIINFFQEGKSHMVLVSDFPGQSKGALGVVTLEDVIEELIGEEIIDESDVFIDVHKAIRRMQPAPKSKFKLEVEDTQAAESDHEVKEADENAPLLGDEAGPKTPVRKSSLQNGKQPSTTFLMRRKSSTASEATRDTMRPLAVRGNTTDMRQHLKHLGPSNAASKPRATKFSSVKIKPGVGTIPENQATTTGTSQSPPPKSGEVITSPTKLSNNGVNESTGLLDQAGKVASDGVVAVHAGYGSTDSPPAQRRGSNERLSAQEASQMAQEHTSPPPKDTPGAARARSSNDRLRVPEKLVIGQDGDNDDGEDDTVGEMSAPSRDRSKSRRTVRSGSITETMVDAGGMKKIVLETTSSSEDLGEANGGDGGKRTNGDAESSQSGSSQGDAEEKKGRKKRGKRKKDGNGK